MKNEFEISNLNEIYKGDFEDMLTLKGLEAYPKSTVMSYYDKFGNILQKSEENELSSEDKDQMEVIKAEVNSFSDKEWVVVDNDFNKKVMLTRPKQIDFEKGIYKDTTLNRKLNRVGKEIKVENKDIR